MDKSSRTWWLGIDGASIHWILYAAPEAGASVTISSPDIIKAGSFQHIGAVFDGRSATLYYNGKAVASANVGMANFNVGNPVNIGREDLTSDGTLAPFRGLIDEVSIYNRALSKEQIEAIFRAGTAGKCML